MNPTWRKLSPADSSATPQVYHSSAARRRHASATEPSSKRTPPVETAQIAPTILAALGLDRNKLIAMQQERTQVLPGLDLETGKSRY